MLSTTSRRTPWSISASSSPWSRGLHWSTVWLNVSTFGGVRWVEPGTKTAEVELKVDERRHLPLRRCRISDSVEGVSTSTLPGGERRQRRLRCVEWRVAPVHVRELRTRDLCQPHAAEFLLGVDEDHAAAQAPGGDGRGGGHGERKAHLRLSRPRGSHQLADGPGGHPAAHRVAPQLQFEAKLGSTLIICWFQVLRLSVVNPGSLYRTYFQALRPSVVNPGPTLRVKLQRPTSALSNASK